MNVFNQLLYILIKQTVKCWIKIIKDYKNSQRILEGNSVYFSVLSWIAAKADVTFLKGNT